MDAKESPREVYVNTYFQFKRPKDGNGLRWPDGPFWERPVLIYESKDHEKLNPIGCGNVVFEDDPEARKLKRPNR